MRARVLLVDDNKEFLQASAQLLGPHFDIVGSADNGLSGIAEYRRLQPDVVVLDISMPVMDGYRAAQELAKLDPSVRIIFLSVLHDQQLQEAASLNAVFACVSKMRMHVDLVPAVRMALERRQYTSPLPE